MMKDKKKRFILILSLVMAVSMAMTACADKDDDDDDDDSSSRKSKISASSSDGESSSDDDDLSSIAVSIIDESSTAGGDDESSDSETQTTTTTTTTTTAAVTDPPDESSGVTTQITDDSSKTTETTTKKPSGGTEVAAGDEGQPVINFFKSLENNDEKMFVNIFPKGMADVLNNYADENHLFQSFRDSLVEDYGDKFTIDVKITQKEEMTAEELSEMNENLKKYFNVELNIAEGYSISADATIHGNGKDDDDTFNTYVGKVDGKWVMLNLF